jgi:non-specific protein-tyrosine kinase
MELRQYFSIIWKWLWLIALGTLLAGGTAYVVSVNTTPVYQASTTLLISEARSPEMSDYTSLLTSERLAKTYSELLKKRPIMEEVIRRFDLELTPSELAGTVSVQLVRDTQLIELQVEGTDPQLAASIADEIPQVFIEQTETMQSTRFAGSKESLARQMAVLEADMESIQQAIDELRSSEAPDQAELARLQGNLAQYQNSYSSLLKSYEEIRLAEAQSIDSVIVVEPAQAPQDPIKPRTLMNTLLAAVVGCMLAVGVVFLIEYLDDTIKTPDDVKSTINLPTLGAVTRIEGAEIEDKLVTANLPRSPVSEAYRILRTNLQFSAVDRPLKTLLVTSANPIEGKSLTAANLSVVMAQAGLSVVIVDTDLRRPVQHRIFRLAKEDGLTNVLLHSNPDPDDYLQTTKVENLRVLTSGPLPPNPSELLGSERMSKLIEHLKEQVDIVLFDSPPCLAVTDAAVLSSQLDGVLLVVDAGASRRELAARAVEGLRKVGGNMLGAVLNKVSPRGSGYYYYYYYYSKDGERTKRRKRKSLRRRLVKRIPLLKRFLG